MKKNSTDLIQHQCHNILTVLTVSVTITSKSNERHTLAGQVSSLRPWVTITKPIRRGIDQWAIDDGDEWMSFTTSPLQTLEAKPNNNCQPEKQVDRNKQPHRPIEVGRWFWTLRRTNPFVWCALAWRTSLLSSVETWHIQTYIQGREENPRSFFSNDFKVVSLLSGLLFDP